MPPITKPIPREIIEDFAKEIREKRRQGPKPSTDVINFRNERQNGIERAVWLVPIEILRYRKENGRIASDVLDYEHHFGRLNETDDDAQGIIGGFLEAKDPQKTADLRQSIMHAGQNEPAIITCDGFLINGNRRKMVLAVLHNDHPANDSFAFMKCVILPGKDDEGGPPTLLEIEKLENRYQLQSEGKSEYYGFDQALSIKRKINLGLSLRDQLKDDPRFVNANDAQLDKAENDYKREYLRPLECVDRYLKQFRREGQYLMVSGGKSDPEGRWQAFIDYSDKLTQYFANPKKLVEIGVDEDEVGAIEEAAFDIIRLRRIPEMQKVHMLMRILPKLCSTRAGKKEIMKIAEEVEPVLPADECVDVNGRQFPLDVLEGKWAIRNQRPIIHRLRNATKIHDSHKEKETPLGLLEAAYKKLTHNDMDLSSVAYAELKTARRLVTEIGERAHDLEAEIYRLQKAGDDLLGK